MSYEGQISLVLASHMWIFANGPVFYDRKLDISDNFNMLPWALGSNNGLHFIFSPIY